MSKTTPPGFKDRSLWLRAYAGLALFSVAGSLLSRVTGLDPGLIAPIASVMTLGAALVAVFWGPIQEWGAAKSAAVLGAAGLAGAAAEVAGLYTGAVFGNYVYTEAWQPILMLPGGKPFPLLLPVAWLMMAGGSVLAVRRLLPHAPGWGVALLGAGLAAGLDVPMEHVMVHVLGYWQWTPPGPLPGGAPWMNVFGWLATSLVAGAIILSSRPQDPRPANEPLEVLLIHAAFLAAMTLVSLTPAA